MTDPLKALKTNRWSNSFLGTVGFLVCACAFMLAVTALKFRLFGCAWATEQANQPNSTDLTTQDPAVTLVPGALEWTRAIDGFEVGELPVVAERAEVDRVLLVRVDPSKFQFVVRHSATGNKRLANWMKELGAVFVINGSYFHSDGSPTAPLLADGTSKGPNVYEAKHGAFVASTKAAQVLDLNGMDWRQVFATAHDGVVSYPFLIAEDGTSRVTADPRKIANRSFVAQDREGKIVLGTTRQGYFGLSNFADFLKKAPLNLKIALNLDGGPLACQGLAIEGFHREFCGHTEVVVRNDQTEVIKQDNGTQLTVLPIVLAILPR